MWPLVLALKLGNASLKINHHITTLLNVLKSVISLAIVPQDPSINAEAAGNVPVKGAESA